MAAETKGTNRVRLRVHTPVRTVLEKDVEYVILRSVEGDIGVLYNHEPCTVQLGYGLLHTSVDGQESDVLMVMGGFATVRENRVTVLTDLAEAPDKIEDVLAEMQRERAEIKQQQQKSGLEMQKAELALRRSLMQIDQSSYAILKGTGDKRES